MNITMVSPFHIPADTGAGVAMVNWAVMEALCLSGHQVTCLSIIRSDQFTEKPTSPIKAVMDMGVKAALTVMETPPSGIKAMVDSTKSDVLFCYTPASLYYTRECTQPKLAAIVDLDFQVNPFRRQYVGRDMPITYGELAQMHQKAQQQKDQEFLPILRSADILVEHAHHHSIWLNNVAGIQCQYVPMPVSDPAFPGWRRASHQWPEREGRTKIVMAGHSNGIATMSGHYFFAEDVMPFLDESFEVHICGDEPWLGSLARRLQLAKCTIIQRGYVADIKKEMLDADIFLCPTPIDLGFRTRLVETMALGVPIVAHAANSLGMPEAKHGENLLLAKNAGEMVEQIYQLAEDRVLAQKLSDGGRQTYEEHYLNSPYKIVELLESLC